MKKLYFLSLSALFLFFTIADTMACWASDWWYSIVSGDSNGGGGGGAGGGDVIGAPLDGGLLAILAVAGFTYFTVRRKKKNKE